MPSASEMPVVLAVRVWPTCAVPVMAGAPVAGVLGGDSGTPGPGMARASPPESLRPSSGADGALTASQPVVAGRDTATGPFPAGVISIRQLRLDPRLRRCAFASSPPVTVRAWSRRVVSSISTCSEKRSSKATVEAPSWLAGTSWALAVSSGRVRLVTLLPQKEATAVAGGVAQAGGLVAVRFPVADGDGVQPGDGRLQHEGHGGVRDRDRGDGSGQLARDGDEEGGGGGDGVLVERLVELDAEPVAVDPGGGEGGGRGVERGLIAPPAVARAVGDRIPAEGRGGVAGGVAHHALVRGGGVVHGDLIALGHGRGEEEQDAGLAHARAREGAGLLVDVDGEGGGGGGDGGERLVVGEGEGGAVDFGGPELGGGAVDGFGGVAGRDVGCVDVYKKRRREYPPV